MIELKPYRGTITAPSDKGKKVRLDGAIIKDKHAYLLAEAPSTPSAFIVIVVALVLSAITASPVWFCVVPIVYLTGIYIVNRVWQNYIDQSFGQPTLLVSTERAGRGESIDLHFRHSIKRDIVIERGTVELLARERVRYKCDDYMCESIHDHLVETEVDERSHSLSAGHEYERRLTVSIPPRVMHSFALPDNSLTWLIRVTLTFKDFMPLSETYAIHVTPEVHTL